MINILGLYLPGKEERRKREEEVLHRYFRYGEAHKERIGRLLEELIPGEKREYLVMYYMQIKDRMDTYGAQSFEEAAAQIKPKYVIIGTKGNVNRYYKAVMEADAQMGEDLALPSAEEIRAMVDRDGKNHTV